MLVLSAIALVSLMGAVVLGAYPHPSAIVETTSGPVQGEINVSVGKLMDYSVFKGIPYAQPPVGDLRFKPPVPVDQWDTTYDATYERDFCPQINSEFGMEVHVGSEDCLFLNIYTPQANLSDRLTDLKPVMFWIHGGHFERGSGNMNFKRPDYLIEKNIVFVSINYRLGPLGFLNLDHPSATGNAGLKDQLLALKWVKANILKFGGDPTRITLLGHGAGAASAGYHVVSKSSAGLFHGVISMSGSLLGFSNFHNTSKAASAIERIGTYLRVDPNDKEALLNALKTATAVKLVASKVAFVPTVERPSIATDPFITESPYQTLYSGNYNKVPQIIGFMEQEAVTFTAWDKAFLERTKEALAFANDIGLKGLDSLTTVSDTINSKKSFDEVDSRTVQAAINIISQLLYESPIDRNQQLLAEGNDGRPVYYYHISFYTNLCIHNQAGSNILGAGHSDVFQYIFYLPQQPFQARVRSQIMIARQKIIEMWTNFAKYRNPTPNAGDVNCCNTWFYHATTMGQCLQKEGTATDSIQWPPSNQYQYALDIGGNIIAKPRRINSNVQLIQTLSWADEKNALNIPGSLRPKLKI